jgi:hypothetical protein
LKGLISQSIIVIKVTIISKYNYKIPKNPQILMFGVFCVCTLLRARQVSINQLVDRYLFLFILS